MATVCRSIIAVGGREVLGLPRKRRQVDEGARARERARMDGERAGLWRPRAPGLRSPARVGLVLDAAGGDVHVGLGNERAGGRGDHAHTDDTTANVSWELHHGVPASRNWRRTGSCSSAKRTDLRTPLLAFAATSRGWSADRRLTGPPATCAAASRRASSWRSPPPTPSLHSLHPGRAPGACSPGLVFAVGGERWVRRCYGAGG